jgi:hypothetical protein
MNCKKCKKCKKSIIINTLNPNNYYNIRNEGYLGYYDKTNPFSSSSLYMINFPNHLQHYWNQYPVEFTLTKPKIHSRLYKPPDFDYSNQIK